MGVTIIYSFGFGQGPTTNLEQNRAALLYFTGAELLEFASEAPTQSSYIKYYFTQSFDVVRINCEECTVDMEVFYNRDLFNIVEFESLRELQNSVMFNFKDKYQITLKPTNNVMEQIGGLVPSEVINIKFDRPFPQWASTGDNEIDFKSYKGMVKQWAMDFPEQYRTFTSSPELLKIRFSDFIILRESRKQELLTRPSGILIID